MSSHTERLAGERSRGYGGIRIVAAMLGIVIVVTVAANTLVAGSAEGLGASSGFAPLTLPVYGAFTAVGVVAGWLGWRIVLRRAARPRTVLTLLVPLVTALSMVPDLLLLALRFIPGANAADVVALMVMHIMVVAHAVPGYVIASRRLRRRTVATASVTAVA